MESPGIPGRFSQASLDKVEGADWSGYDHKRRLIFAQAGKLYRRTNGRDREIIDLNDRVPDPVAAPDWATRPIGHRPRIRRYHLRRFRQVE